jgi:hypothetical protein
MLAVRVFKRSVLALVENLYDLFYISAFWVPAMIISSLPFTLASATTDPLTDQPMPWIFSQAWYISVPGTIIPLIILILGSAITAIAWHMLLILGERPERVLVWPKYWEIKRYFFNGLALFLIPFVAMIGFAIFIATQQVAAGDEIFQETGFAIFWETLIFNFLILFFFLVWGLKLPAIATGSQAPHGGKFKFGDSWALVKPRFIEVFLLVVLMAVASALFTSIQTTIFPENLIVDLGTFVAQQISGFLGYLFVFITVGALSELYKELS